MTYTKHDLLARINHKCNQLEELYLSYRSLEQMAMKDGQTQEFTALVDSIGTVTLSHLSDAGNLMETLLQSSTK